MQVLYCMYFPTDGTHESRPVSDTHDWKMGLEASPAASSQTKAEEGLLSILGPVQTYHTLLL